MKRNRQTTNSNLVTERLIGEKLMPHHLPHLQLMDRDPRIMDNIGGVRSEDETQTYLNTNLDHWKEHDFGLWILSQRADDAFVGRAALRRMTLGGREENVIGYALLPDFWGRGLATEIVTAILDLAFNSLGMKDAVAGALPDNLPSRRVIEKVGGRYEKDTYHKNAPHVVYRFKPGQGAYSQGA